MSDPSSFELESTAETTAEGHAAAEGVEPADTQAVGSQRTLREMLMSTDPGTPLHEVESPWNPDDGGMARIMRGIQKATAVDGLPAVADVVIGAAEWWTSIELGGDDSAEDGDGSPVGGEPT